jgi:hypothetical protein
MMRAEHASAPAGWMRQQRASATCAALVSIEIADEDERGGEVVL